MRSKIFLIIMAVLTAIVLLGCHNPATPTTPATGTPDGVSYSSANIGTLKYVPAGRFERDATAANISVISQPYRMSQNEITRAQFNTIMGADPSNTTYSSGTSDPVQMTNWYHAIAFCNKLSLAEGLTPVYAVTGVDFSTLTYASIPTSSDTNWDAATATWCRVARFFLRDEVFLPIS